MTESDIVRMANQIAAFFRAYPQEEAVAGVAKHIRDFWEPRMREALARHLAAGGEGLDPVAREGAERALADEARAA
jgi:formate dehydrogenase subunit delta